MNIIINNIQLAGRGFIKFWNDGDIDLFLKSLLSPVITLTPSKIINKFLEFLSVTIIFLTLFLAVAYVSFTAVSAVIMFFGEFFLYTFVGMIFIIGTAFLYKYLLS